MKALVIDIGGNNVKILATGQTEARKVPSGPTMTPEEMVSAVKKLADGWEYDVVSVRVPGICSQRQVELEPHNLGPGWVGFDFAAAFGCRVKLMNDAAMQALGSYQGKGLLFLGLGTGLGSALVFDGVVVPMELGHLSYRKATFEEYVGNAGLKRLGRKKWQKHVEFDVTRLIAALHPDDVVLGGGNAKKLKELPAGCRVGANGNAFEGGFRLWTEPGTNRRGKPNTKRPRPAPRKKKKQAEDQHEPSTPGSNQGASIVESSGNSL